MIGDLILPRGRSSREWSFRLISDCFLERRLLAGRSNLRYRLMQVLVSGQAGPLCTI